MKPSPMLGWLSEKYPAASISLGLLDGIQGTRKYGKNDAITVPETIWAAGGLYPWQSAAYRAEVISDDDLDDAGGTGALTVRIEGLAGADWVLASEDITMDGQVAVLTDRTDWVRIQRVHVLTAGAGLVNAGNITVRLASAGAIQAYIPAATGQTLQAAMTVPGTHDGVIHSWAVHILNAVQSSEVELALFTRDNDIVGRSWRLRSQIGLKSTGTTSQRSSPIIAPLHVLPKTDIEARAVVASHAGLAIASTFEVLQVDSNLLS